MNITKRYIAYCIEWSAATDGERRTGRVGEGGSDTPICNYNIPPVTNQKNKKGLPCA